MIAEAFSRAVRMDRDELRFRARTAVRQLGDRVRLSFQPPRWETVRLRELLLQPADARGLAGHFRSRPRKFPLRPADRPWIRAAILAGDPDAEADARRRGDAIVDGRLSILGYHDLAVGSPVDWHRDPVHGRSAPKVFWASVPYLDPGIGDHKVIWEINRHQHWLALGRAAWLTGESVYAHEIVAQLRGWLAQNPPLAGINWASMLELGFRSLSWIWALQFCCAFEEEDATADAWIGDLLIGLDAQLEHVRRNLSRYFSPNTHLLGEALALYVAGRALPELKRAAPWADTGRAVLIEQTTRQVNPDGGHAELSAHYHRYALDFYLLALTIARLTDDAAAAGTFEGVCRRLARFARALADDRGRLPLLGDDDGGQLFPICGCDPADATPTLGWAAVLLQDRSLAIDPENLPEEVFWLTGQTPRLPEGPSARAAEPALTVFRETGYAIARTARNDHAVIDVGPHGFLNGGHAHADALALVLTMGGRPLLIDAGTSTYTMNPALRDRMRASAMHNTLTLDGRAQAEPAGPFHWRTTNAARLLRADRLERGVWTYGEQTAYAPALHRRGLFLSDDGLALVIDVVLDDAPHAAEARWHLDRSWEYQPAPNGARLIHSSGAELRILSSAELRAVRGGDEAGWCAPLYGQLLPTWTLIASVRGAAPLEMVTVFSEGSVPPGLRWHAEGSGTARRVTVEVARQGRVDALTIDADGRVTHACRVASSVHAGTR